MGIAFSIVGVSLLIGTPIEGALLPSRDGRYVWDNSIIFCAVGHLLHFISPLSETSVYIGDGPVRSCRNDDI
jgi:hypothetical protein